MIEDFERKTDYLTETKGLLKDRINSLGGSITSGTTFRDYLVWLDSLYEALDEKTITGLPDSLEGKCEQDGTPTPTSPQPINITTGRQVVSVKGKNLFNEIYPNIVNNTTKYVSLYVGDGTFTMSSNVPLPSNDPYASLFFITGQATSGASTGGNGVYLNRPITISSTNGYVTIGYRIYGGTNPEDYQTQVEKSNQATTYEEYKGNDYEINLGKNMLNPIGVSQTYGGITFTNNGDGTFTANGTATANGSFTLTNLTTSPLTLEKNQTYTQTLEVISGTWAGNILPAFKNSSGTISYNYFNSSASSPVSTKTTTDYMTCHTYTFYITTGNTITNCRFRVQLEKGSQSTGVSLYKTPIYLGKIGNYQDYINKSTGKNLFDKDNTTTQVGYFNTTGGIESGGQSTVTTSYIPILPNTNLTISGFVVNRICYYDQNKNFLERSEVISTTPYTFNKNAYYIRIQGVTDVFNLNNFQLEKGNQASDFEPYGEGQWYIHKEIGRVVLNGSENWYYTVATKRFSNVFSNINLITPTDSSRHIEYIKSNYFYNSTSDVDGSIFQYQNQIIVHNYNYTNITDFKNWLSSHNVELYYVLETPTNTLIEDEELINQLNEIEIFTVISEDFYN